MGAVVAQRILERELADVVLIDVVEGVPQGKALDMAQSGPLEGFDAQIEGTNDYSKMKDSAVVVVTAGIARKPGMPREDLLQTNAKIAKDVSEKIKQVAPASIIVWVSNPLDIMTQLAQAVSGFDSKRVLGMAGVLDSARFRTFIAWELGVSAQDVQTMVLGGHGDSMVPLPRYTTFSGIPLTQLLKKDRIDALVQRTRDGGAEIVKHLKTGSAYYAPASGAVEMVEAIIRDEKRVIPSSAYLTGQYGLRDVYIGVPVKIGANGVEDILEVELTDDEKKALHVSAGVVAKNIAELKQWGIL